MWRVTRAAQLAPFVVCLIGGRIAAAQSCEGSLRRDDVVRCALAASLDVRLARAELKSIEARRIEAGVVLPTNPVIAGQVMGRVGGANVSIGKPVEWQVSLSQEIEIAGQRSARRARVDAQVATQLRRVAAAEKEVGAAALGAYFDALAADATLALTDELARTSDGLAVYAEERAKESLVAPIDAHAMRAEAVRFGLLRASAQERRDLANAALATLLARHEVSLAGDDLPQPADRPVPTLTLIARGLAARADLAVAETERRVAERDVELLKLTRVPNPTLTAFTGLNVLGEQEVGGTLSLPIPLPAPIGHTNAGPIAEANAKRQEADVAIERLQRQIRLEVTQAVAAERARAAALSGFSPKLLQQAHADLQALRDGIASRQLSIRDALQAQRTLIELLLADVDARLAYARSWVQLKRATGDLPTEEQR